MGASSGKASKSEPEKASMSETSRKGQSEATSLQAAPPQMHEIYGLPEPRKRKRKRKKKKQPDEDQEDKEQSRYTFARPEVTFARPEENPNKGAVTEKKTNEGTKSKRR